MRSELKALKRRLEACETAAGADAAIVALWVSQGLYYDELDVDNRELYAHYKNSTRSVLEEVEQVVTGSLHFKLQLNDNRPNAVIKAEVEAYINQYIEEYNKQKSEER